jgi:hypothetical protein
VFWWGLFGEEKERRVEGIEKKTSALPPPPLEAREKTTKRMNEQKQTQTQKHSSSPMVATITCTTSACQSACTLSLSSAGMAAW